MDGDRLQVVSGGEDGIVCAIDPCTGDTLLRSAVHGTQLPRFTAMGI